MSLKKFHIIFILITSILMTYFAYWSYTNWTEFRDISYLIYFILSSLTFVLLLFYSNKFINKYKGIIN